jgi:hypothetical protein
MKTICQHFVAATLSLVALSQCQSTSLGDTSRKDYRVTHRQTIHDGDKTFVQKRRVISDNPPESILEYVQVR